MKEENDDKVQKYFGKLNKRLETPRPYSEFFKHDEELGDMVSEAGFYLTMFALYLDQVDDGNPNIVQFCEWVLCKVLPDISRNGMYVLTAQEDIAMLNAMRDAKRYAREKMKEKGYEE